MAKHSTESLVTAIRERAHPLNGDVSRWDPLLNMVGDARFVLLGEATHGTADFYRARSEITRRLITDCGFDAVAVEADWPDAYRVNRFVRGDPRDPGDRTAIDALGDFRRFPLWMWRNTDVAAFVQWLHDFNARRDFSQRIGFYGLDLYSLYSSVEAVVGYLQQVDPPAAEQARKRYECLDRVGHDGERNVRGAFLGTRRPCEDQAVEQLMTLRRNRSEYLQYDGLLGEDEQFFAEQNARVVLNAEEYYRGMFQSETDTWNLRDSHMYETLSALANHLSRQGRRGRIVVWEHNSHVGDARATTMGERGEWNLGQLVRKEYGNDSLLVGFTTYCGTVIAASDWEGPMIRQVIRPAVQGSYESLFHAAGVEQFLLPLRDSNAGFLDEPRLERAVGVIYHPARERRSHYFYSRLARQFDAVVHFDRTDALEPLDKSGGWKAEEVPETYPFGE